MTSELILVVPHLEIIGTALTVGYVQIFKAFIRYCLNYQFA